MRTLTWLALLLLGPLLAAGQNTQFPPVGEDASIEELVKSVAAQPYNADRVGLLAGRLLEEGYLVDAVASFQRQIELLVDIEDWRDLDISRISTVVGLQLTAVLTKTYMISRAIQRNEDALIAIELAHQLSPMDKETRQQYITFTLEMGLVDRNLQLQFAHVSEELAEAYDWTVDEALTEVKKLAMTLWGTGLEDMGTSLARSLLSVENRTSTLNIFKEKCGYEVDLDELTPFSVPRTEMVRLMEACSLTQNVPRTLKKLGAKVDAVNAFGFTALHHAAGVGAPKLRKEVSYVTGISLNAKTDLGLTPLHHAISMDAPLEVLADLIDAGASLTKMDKWGRLPIDIAAIRRRKDHVRLLLDMGSRDPPEALQWNSFIAPMWTPQTPLEDLPTAADSDWRGGWLPGSGRAYQFDDCDFNTLDLDEMTTEIFIRDYLSINRPFRVRAGEGALFKRLREAWTRTHLKGEFGPETHNLGAVPYAHTFNMSTTEVSLTQYLNDMRKPKKGKGKGKGKGKKEEGEEEEEAMNYMFTSVAPGHRLRRKYFRVPEFFNPRVTNATVSNVQFYIGAEGTGAPIHFHDAAWNILVYGEKFWAIWPPHEAIYSKKPSKQYFAQEGKCLLRDDLHPCPKGSREAHALRCVQRPGDLLFVPESWAHATLNGAETVGVASEFAWGQRVFVPGVDTTQKHLMERPLPVDPSKQPLRNAGKAKGKNKAVVKPEHPEQPPEEFRDDENPSDGKGVETAFLQELENRPEDANELYQPPQPPAEWGAEDPEL